MSTKVHLIKAMVFPVVMYGCESWTVKKAEHWRIDAFELWCWRRLLRVPWTAIHPKGDQSWVFTGRTDTEAETPTLWPPDVKSWLTGKDPDAGKDWGQEEKGMTEDEMVGWHHWLSGHEFGWTPGVGNGPACCDSWGHKESDTTERINWTERKNSFGVMVQGKECTDINLMDNGMTRQGNRRNYKLVFDRVLPDYLVGGGGREHQFCVLYAVFIW